MCAECPMFKAPSTGADKLISGDIYLRLGVKVRSPEMVVCGFLAVSVGVFDIAVLCKAL